MLHCMAKTNKNCHRLTKFSNTSILNTSSTQLLIQHFHMTSMYVSLYSKNTPLQPHLWLPRAQAEAPVEGSIVLAAEPVRFWGCGILWITTILNTLAGLITYPFFILSLGGITITSSICLHQTDLKALIVYSCQSHSTCYCSVQWLSHVRLFVIRWTAAHQASLSITNSQSLLKLVSCQWCHPTISSSVISFSCLQSFPALAVFPVSEFFPLGGQSIGISASASSFQWIFRTDFL